MKNNNRLPLLLLTLILFSYRNSYTYPNHEIVNICTINNGTDLVSWHPETDEQFFARINREYETIITEYRSTMDCFGISEMKDPNSLSEMPDIPEEVLLAFATYIGNRKISYHDYISGLQIKKRILESIVEEYCRRFDSKQFDIGHMMDYHIISGNLYKKKKLLAEVKLFLQRLESHKAYFVSNAI